MKNRFLQLDTRHRSVSVDGQTTVLQERSWQVLMLLQSQAPEVVSRADLINTLWQSNPLTGEKGLNQAIWAIRAALGDDAKDPSYVRTLPRVGYQWIHTDRMPIESGASKFENSSFAKAAGVAMLFLIPVFVAYMQTSAPGMAIEPTTNLSTRVATKAYLVDQDIHVKFESGCLGILKNDSNLAIGSPVLSSDGAKVAVTVRKENSCRLMTIDVSNGERQEFGACPSDVI